MIFSLVLCTVNKNVFNQREIYTSIAFKYTIFAGVRNPAERRRLEAPGKIVLLKVVLILFLSSIHRKKTRENFRLLFYLIELS